MDPHHLNIINGKLTIKIAYSQKYSMSASLTARRRNKIEIRQEQRPRFETEETKNSHKFSKILTFSNNSSGFDLKSLRIKAVKFLSEIASSFVTMV